MSHTPGPWKVANGSLYAQWSVPGQWHGLPSSEDNLRLQAAAPTLANRLLAIIQDPKVREHLPLSVKAAEAELEAAGVL